jgi:hypothetical protein
MIGILRKQSRAVFVACHAILRRKIKSKTSQKSLEPYGKSEKSFKNSRRFII